MKLRHKPTVVDAVLFRPGMEDGIDTAEYEGREPWDSNYTIDSPYIRHNHKKIYITFGDWLITESDGKKYGLSNEDVEKYFDKVTDEVDLKLSAVFEIDKV